MHRTNLIEFQNKHHDLLRGIFLSNSDNKMAVLMCGGFERSATTEKKFKVLADKLTEKNISSLRFDYSGCGLSDGDFSNITVEKMRDDLHSAINVLEEKLEIENISIICHSLSACAIVDLIKEVRFEKIILLSPALNQKGLLRYWLTKSVKEKENPNIKINWNNYNEYLNEVKFQEDCLRSDKMTKTNYVRSDYYLENKEKDYSEYSKDNQNILHIHRNNDDKVPLESLNIKFKNKVIVDGADHDMERPDMFAQWIDRAVNFIKN